VSGTERTPRCTVSILMFCTPLLCRPPSGKWHVPYLGLGEYIYITTTPMCVTLTTSQHARRSPMRYFAQHWSEFLSPRRAVLCGIPGRRNLHPTVTLASSSSWELMYFLDSSWDVLALSWYLRNTHLSSHACFWSYSPAHRESFCSSRDTHPSSQSGVGTKLVPPSQP